MADPFTVAAMAAFCSGRAHQYDGFARRFQRGLRAALAAALAPAESAEWFDFLDGQDMRPFAEANPLLSLKQFRVYLSSRWSPSRRRKVIRDTYRFAMERGGTLAEALRSDAGIALAYLPLSKHGQAQVLVGMDQRFRKEGELVLCLCCHALGGKVMSLSMSLERRSDSHLAILIGCVQGEADGASAIKDLTKAMHGLRPKALMVLLAQEFARAVGAQELLGAGNGIQAHGRKHLIHLKGRHSLGFDYDAFWSEAGGQEGFDGWFRLPLAPSRREASEIKPNKRQMYAKRYAMLDHLTAQIQDRLNR